MRQLVLVALLAGCGVSSSDLRDGEGPPPADAPPDCAVALRFNPESPVAGPLTTIRVAPIVLDAVGVAEYMWSVRLDGELLAFTPAQADGSEIDVRTPVPGTYRVNLSIVTGTAFCPPVEQAVTVRAPGGLRERVRLRVVPQAGVAPPLEQLREIEGGANASLGILSIDTGTAVSALVRGASAPGPLAGIPAYLRFAPNGTPEATVEAFADASGLVATRLFAQPHSVVVVPSVGGIAPRRIADWSPSIALDRLDLSAGAKVTGSVRDPANAALAGATVKLMIDGVPSTVGSPGADGAFELLAVPRAGATVTVEVTAPAASGLPRLVASSPDLDLGVPLQIRYDAGLARRDLAGVRVRRAGGPVAGAKLMVVGALAGAGTVTAGGAAGATGEVRIAITADATGTLPGALVPAAALSAVVTVAAGDLAVAPLDATGAITVIDAPPMQPVAVILRGPGPSVLPGAVLDAVPLGALAMASAPTLHVTAGLAGRIDVALAAGGRYDLRFRDPAGRAAALVVADRAAATVAAEYRLPRALELDGTLMLSGTRPLAGALVQILCADCTGLDRARPIAEDTSDAAGRFSLAVPDPGTQ
jgi:hypothetical protein